MRDHNTTVSVKTTKYISISLTRSSSLTPTANFDTIKQQANNGTFDKRPPYIIKWPNTA